MYARRIGIVAVAVACLFSSYTFLAGHSGGMDRHAWVVFEQGDQSFLLESVVKDGTAMIRPLSEARAEYVPHFSADATFKLRSHAGYLLYLKKREEDRSDDNQAA